VIGKGSDPELEVNVDAALAANVQVLRRGTGGCAVVLSPEMVVASFVICHENQLQSRQYFRLFNSLIMDALARQSVTGLEHRGISDIAINGRKIAGTAIYRNRYLVFFHAIINVAGDTRPMERFLKIPPRVPDYRAGRSHREFVTSLSEQGYDLNLEQFERDLQARFAAAEVTA